MTLTAPTTAARTAPALRRPAGTGSHPIYELRAVGRGRGDMELEIWQMPSASTPRLRTPERTATLKGRPLRLVESRVLKRLHSQGVRLPTLKKNESAHFDLDEDIAVNLALLFRVLAPMRSIDRIRTVASGVDNMTREEAAYWLSMAVHRKYPRRVLAALRTLLTTP